MDLASSIQGDKEIFKKFVKILNEKQMKIIYV